MNHTSPGAAALALLLVSTAAAQEAPPPERWIVSFEHSSAPLDALRGAIRRGEVELAEALVAQAEQSARQDRAAFADEVSAAGGRMTRSFWLIPACVIEGPAGAIDLATRYPGVVSVHRDAWREPAALGASPIGVATNDDNHAADAVQAQGIRGAGVTVAIVDSGVDVDMAGSGRPHATFFPGGDPTSTTGGGIGGSRVLTNTQVGQVSADDLIGHGTRVAAVAVGARWNQTPQADDGHAPESKLASYSIAETGNGTATLVAMVAAWQQVVADAASLGTKVAVIGYDGSEDPSFPEQQAIDAAAEVGDLLITTIAGNDPNSQLYYHGTVNALAIGAVISNSKAVTWFTAGGPLFSPPSLVPRTYPHLVANGQDVNLPTADNEATNTTSTGTSYSAPQAAGAAALFRSVATQATGLETRAALLATTEDVRAANAGFDSVIGWGYLRDDRLLDLAQGNGLLTSGSVSLNHPGQSFAFPVTAGRSYAVALSWSRRNVAASQWANLDLRVSLNGQLVAESSLLEDTNERVVFDAPFGGTASIEVTAVRFETGRLDQDFAIAASRTFSPMITSFGQGCPGTRGPISLRSVEPDTLAPSTFGNSSSNALIGDVDHRTQQWVDATRIPGAFNMRGIALRHDDVAAPLGQRVWVDLSIDLSLSTARASTMTSTFANNDGLRKTRVLTRKKVVLPALAAPNNDADTWAVVIPFDQAFDRLYDSPPNQVPIQGLIVDVRKYGSSLGSAAVNYPMDAMQGTSVSGGTLFAPSPTATTGTLTRNLATVLGLIDDLGTVHVPVATGSGTPIPGGGYDVRLADARPSSPLVMTWGLSRTSLGPVGLPIDLAPLDAPGCWLFTSLETTTGLITAPDGSATLAVSVPNLPALTGGRLHHQAIVLDPLANPFGLTTSNGVAISFGD